MSVLHCLRKVAVAVALLAGATGASAYSFVVDDIYYTISSSVDKTATVTYGAEIEGTYSGHLRIPAQVTAPSGVTYTVTAIDDRACYECPALRSVTIPPTVATVGKWAFYRCTSLARLVIEDAPERISIESASTTSGVYNNFKDCPLNDIYIGRPLTYIVVSGSQGQSPFANHTAIERVTLAGECTQVRQSAFYGCTGLKQIVLGPKVSVLDGYCFYQCANVEALVALEPTYPSVYGYAISSINKNNCLLIVTTEGESSFRSSSTWRAFKNIRVRSNDACNPADYQYDMVAYIRPTVDGTPVTDDLLYQIGAYVGDECRGTARRVEADGIGAYWMLRIRSNRASGESIAIRLRDLRNDLTVEWAATLPFRSGEIWGMPSAPYDIDFREAATITYLIDGEQYYTATVALGAAPPRLADPTREGYRFGGWSWIPATMQGADVTVTGSFTPWLTQTYDLHAGWNLISTNLADGVPLQATFGSAIDHAIGPEGEAHLSGSSLAGTLTRLQPGTAYKVHAPTACSVTASGPAVDYAKPIELRAGWNQLAFPLPSSATIYDLFEADQLCADDYISTLTDFAVYNNGHWTGTLTSLAPGCGFLFLSANPRSITPRYIPAPVSEPVVLNP